VTVWSIGDAGTELFTLFSLETNDGTGGIAFSPDGTRLIAGAKDLSALKVWDVSKSGDAEVLSIPTIVGFGDVAFTPNGKLVAADQQGHVRLWDLGSGEGGEPIGSLLDEEHSFALSPDGTMIAYHDGTVWSTSTGQLVLALTDGGGLDGISWAPGSNLLAVVGADDTRIIDLAGRTIETLPNQRAEGVWMSSFSPDGRLLATIDGGGAPAGSEISIWDWRREEVVRTIQADSGESVMFDPTGSRLLASWGSASIWAVETGERLTLLDGYPTAVEKAVFSPDGSQIAAGQNATVRVFDAASGLPLLTLRGGTSTIARVAFSADGTMVASQAPGDAVRVWALDIDTLLAIAQRNVTRSFTATECHQYLHRDDCSA
jgi:WD40 repeat protein